MLPDPVQTRAVLVGVSEGCTTFGRWAHDLPAVANNLADLRRALTDGTVWRLPEEHCASLHQPASAKTVLRELKHAAEAASDTLLVYLAGHGHLDRDNRLHLVLPGAQDTFDCLAYDEVHRLVRGRNARQAVVIVDCCWSGAAIGGNLHESVRAGTAIEGACVFTAGPAHAPAMAPPGERRTAYTDALLTVLTEGVPDRPEQLRAGDVNQAVRALLAERPDVPMPAFAAYGSGSEIVLARNAAYGSAPAAVEEPEPFDAEIGIVEHDVLVRGLDRVGRFLDRLPFVPPPEDSDFHPDNLFSRLAEGNGSEVLLLGAGGVGKTRTCFEVAKAAKKRGWRVLHVLSGGLPVTAEQLRRAVTARPGPVLVIIDYLNESPELGPEVLRRQLLPLVRARQPVAVLASARPRWYWSSQTAENKTFPEVVVDPDAAQRAGIRDLMIERLAPDAAHFLGEDQLREQCGAVPAPAMLCALAAQELFERGMLTRDIRSIRSDDMLGWLSRRLAKDFPPPESDGPLHLARDPDADLQALAAMLAVTPQDEQTLIGCGAAFVGGPDGAARLLGITRTMGWLVDGPQGVTAGHDLFTEQILEKVLLDKASGTVRTEVAARILGVGLGRARSLGRLAVNLDRTLQELSGRPPGERLAAWSAQWLLAHAAEAGEVIAERPEEGAAALSALLGSQTWSAAAVSAWNELAGPWAERHGHPAAVRRVLANGLRAVPADAGGELVDRALRLLAETKEPRAAVPLLRALLDYGRPGGARTREILDVALAWLAEHRRLLEAEPVLDALLHRADLRGEELGKVVSSGLRWLESRPGDPRGSRVLEPMLIRVPELEDRQGTRVVKTALEWLDSEAGMTTDATFVLRRLLDLRELDGELARPAYEAAYRWLAGNRPRPEASFVYGPLFGNARRLPADLGAKAAELALDWLDSHVARSEARYVLNGLFHLGIPVERLTDVCLAFLDVPEHQTAPGTEMVLRPLLEHRKVPGPVRERAKDVAMVWLSRNSRRLRASYVLRPMLRHYRYDPRAAEVTAFAERWLAAHPDVEEASFVHQYVLSSQEPESPLLQSAWEWLRSRPLSLESRFTLAKLLAREDADAEAVRMALDWLERFGTHFSASHILAPLLKRQDRADVLRALPSALAWLERHGGTPAARYVLVPLVDLDELPDEARPEIVRRALAWPGALTHKAFLARVLDHMDGLDRPLVKRAFTLSMCSLEGRESSPNARYLLWRLLRLHGLDDAERLAVTDLALAWLEKIGPRGMAVIVLHHLLRPVLPDSRLPMAVAHALEWLEVSSHKGIAQLVILALLTDPRITGPDRDEALAHARRWLSLHPDAPGSAELTAALAAEA